jgi:[ribosomal protein S5]-alanine N-acetyltransferase
MFAELQTERFYLQQVLPEDQAFVFEGLSHSAVILYYGVQYDSFEATAAQLEFYQRCEQEGTGRYWKIVSRETGAKAGVIGFNNYQQKHRKAEIGYWLLPTFWKQGIIAEVLPVMVRYMQQELDIHRIESLVEEGNTSSFAVMERAGFVYEGTMRDCEIKNGKFISLRIYSLLRGNAD